MSNPGPEPFYLIDPLLRNPFYDLIVLLLIDFDRPIIAGSYVLEVNVLGHQFNGLAGTSIIPKRNHGSRYRGEG